jgi:hypothetical protein
MKNKNNEDEPEFTNLLADFGLRKSVLQLTLENPTDASVLDRILNKQDGNLTISQRVWIQTLIDRNGRAWNID